MKRLYDRLFSRMIFINLVVMLVTSSVLAIPPDPDNAALLYYQAFLSLAEIEDDAMDHLAEVTRGRVAPDESTLEYINKCNGAIKFAEAAEDVPFCNWGVRYSQGFECLLPQMAQARHLTFVLIADARIRSSDGDYRGALERCLMTGQFARHVGEDTIISYLVSLSVRTLGYKCVQDIVGRISNDSEQLQWLKNEFVTSENYTLSPVRPLKIEMEIVTDLMQMKNVEKLARVLVNSGAGDIAGSDEGQINDIIKRADENILEHARKIYSERMNSALLVLSTSMQYETAYEKLKHLSDNLDPNDPAQATASVFIPALFKIYSQDTMRRTTFNAIVTAIEIYISRIESGKLPDELPNDMPKDLFSGKDFKYEKTDDGFVLSCPSKDSDMYKFSFKVE